MFSCGLFRPVQVISDQGHVLCDLQVQETRDRGTGDRCGCGEDDVLKNEDG